MNTNEPSLRSIALAVLACLTMAACTVGPNFEHRIRERRCEETDGTVMPLAAGDARQ